MADNIEINQEMHGNVISDNDFSNYIANKLHQIASTQKHFLKSMIKMYVNSVKLKDTQNITTISGNGNENEASVSPNTECLENSNNIVEDHVGTETGNTNNEIPSQNISMEAGPSVMDTSRISPTPIYKIMDNETSLTSENNTSDVNDLKVRIIKISETEDVNEYKGGESSSDSDLNLLSLKKKLKKKKKEMKKKKKKAKKKRKKEKEREKEKKNKELLQKHVKCSKNETSDKSTIKGKSKPLPKHKLIKGRIIKKCFYNQIKQDESERSEDSS